MTDHGEEMLKRGQSACCYWRWIDQTYTCTECRRRHARQAWAIILATVAAIIGYVYYHL